jgi:putative ABC transport system permease protein
MRRACSRLLSVFRKRALDREFDDEVRSHLELAAEDYAQRGVPPAEARRLARVKFGAVEVSKDAHRDARGLPCMDGFFGDLRFALRGLQRDRAFTITAIVILALAIGLNTTLFAVMNTMLFRGFPLVKRNDRLVYMQERNPLRACCLSYLDFEDWRAQGKSFAGMALVAGRPITFSGGEGRPMDTFAATLSANAFGLLGVQPILGRDFLPGDEAPGAPPVMILSYRFWEAHFAKHWDIVGRMVRIDKAPATVIGVMPQGFDFPEQQNLWMPLAHTPELEQRAPKAYMAFGRLAEGVTVAAARAELETINRRLAVAYPATNRDVVPRVNMYAQFFIGPDAPMIYGSLWAGAWFVLLIACANLANLMLARTLGRSREFSTRLALGAGHWRLIRQILSEALLLAAAASLPAWWITRWSITQWATATASRYQILDYTLDYGTLGYLIGISIAAAILFGLAPIGRVLQLARSGALTGAPRGTTPGMRSKSLSRALVAGQMALAMVLLSGAGVLVRSFWKLVTADVGVASPEYVLAGSLSVPRDKYTSVGSRAALFDSLRARLLSVPGIKAVAVASHPPLGGSLELHPAEVEARHPGPMGVIVLNAGTDYFHTVGATTLAGREFNDRDRAAAQRVAIVNQSFAARFLSGEDLLGKRLRLYDRDRPGEWRTIVGVVSNIRQADPTRQRFVPLVYLPFEKDPPGSVWFFARARTASDRVIGAVRAEVQKLDPDLVLEDYSTLKDSFQFRADRMDVEHVEMGKNAAVAPIFAGMALLLAAIGLYAVIGHSVNQRTREIGIRMAIGAAADDIRRLILREGMSPVAVGLFVGLLTSLGVNRLLQSQLIGVSPYDPVTMAGAPVILIVTALMGCRIPARRAMRLDPAVALRHD